MGEGTCWHAAPSEIPNIAAHSPLPLMPLSRNSLQELLIHDDKHRNQEPTVWQNLGLKMEPLMVASIRNNYNADL